MSRAYCRIIANDLLAGIPPHHHVIDGALELDSRSSWHLGSLEVRKLAVKRKPENKGRHREAAPRRVWRMKTGHGERA